MNILLINHYAGSPKMGMEFRPYYLAKEWISMGNNVTIIAANNSHIRQYNPKMKENIETENIEGINYIWIKTPPYNGNGVGRIKNIFTFIKTIFLNADFFATKYKPDVVIASSTYPSDNYVAKKIAKKANAKHIYEVHDLWPLSPMELGNMSKFHPFIIMMQYFENHAYRKADLVVSMLPKTQEHMKAHGLDLNKWHYIPNGITLSDWEEKQHLNSTTKNVIQEIKKRHNLTIAYTGTLGLANALDSFIISAKANKKVGYVLVGKGPEKHNLQNIIAHEKINNVFILDAVSKQEIPELLSLFDYLYIGLQYQPLFRFGISPNKLIDYMMAEKPIIQAIEAGNNVVKEVGCGIDITPEKPEAIVEAIEKLNSLTTNELEQMSKNGRKFVLENHDYKKLAEKFIQIIEKS